MQPLAERLRPTTLDDYIGQKHLVGENGKARKVAFDVVARGLQLDAQRLRQPERAHAVNQSEIDGLGVAPTWSLI